ncbi:MAG: hypothetical protein WC309_02425 [Candidatus Paceibacterota bacterium]|jgi:hypothetical protein
MELKEYQLRILELLTVHEEGMSELYSIYSQKFPTKNNLWSTLSQEEVTHASWIRKLTDMVKGGTVYFNEGRFTVEALESSLRELQGEIAKAKGDIPLISALSTGYYFEMALLERKFYEVFEGDSVELKHLLVSLEEGTKQHQDRIKEALNEERQKM